MYTPTYFAENNPAEILDVIRKYPFGLLLTADGGELSATHLPFLADVRDGQMTLTAHMARANPHWRRLTNTQAIVVFRGPHGYVSPSWYADPKHSVPTWNYVAVHCRGAATLLDDAGTREALRRLVNEMESGFPNPWSVEFADPGYRETQARAIVGFEIAVQQLEAKFKLSQNRTPEERERVAEELQSSSVSAAHELGAFMAAYESRGAS